MVKVPDKNTRHDRNGRIIGVVATVMFHLLLCLFFLNTGMKQIEKQEEMGILLDFSEPVEQPQEPEPPKPIEVKAGNEPKPIDAEPNKEIKE